MFGRGVSETSSDTWANLYRVLAQKLADRPKTHIRLNCRVMVWLHSLTLKHWSELDGHRHSFII